ncbi:MAG: DUF4956 domain-containing protein [Oscillospiraceae bacterium]|nr:DUF4956 domain-containing protein [Oscillospiraceae bacterium]
MLENIFRGLFDSDTASVISVGDFLLCVICALAIGLIAALMYMYRTRYTKSFVVTLAVLPAVGCGVIMMGNGNVGTGVAVAGAFSLVRFRSAPGTAKEIGALFLAMGAGLICGMGYLAYAVLFTLIVGAVGMVYNALDFGEKKNAARHRTLHITIPEDLEYTQVFQPLLEEYTSAWELEQVKTTNMGSLFRLTYNVTMRSSDKEKEFIDKLRCRNGNLEISMTHQATTLGEL